MSRSSKTRPDYRRASLADEAARIIQEQGLTDFRLAKEKAVERLGAAASGPLPSNAEIEQALAERNRIFRGNAHDDHVRQLREAALPVLRGLDTFHARLVGSVLSGNATEYSTIDLHLFSDSPEAVGARLDELRFHYRSTQFRHQFKLRQAESFPGYRFIANDFEYAATVFTEVERRRAPLSPIGGRPMQRAGIAEIEALINV